jgi:Mg-chelatase subunit ChlD
MKGVISNQKGTVIVIFALTILVLIGMAALGIEAGRWYIVRAELSKAVDAAALAGATYNSTDIDYEALAEDFGRENFFSGYLGTPASGTGTAEFNATRGDYGRIEVRGTVNAIGILSRLFGVDYVANAATGIAQRNRVEIMMILDRSGSMDGTPLRNLKTAAKAFLSYYEETQNEDKIGMVSFATGVTLNRPLATNFYDAMIRTIDGMSATGATNAEDAIARAGAQFSDQRPIDPPDRVQQFIIFFTDGRPTAFRSQFTRRGTNYDAVVCTGGNCDSTAASDLWAQMGYTDREAWYPTSTLSPTETGDGVTTASTVCRKWERPGSFQPYQWVPKETTRWGSFSSYPVSGLGAERYPQYCFVPASTLGGRTGYVCTTARQMAIANAASLKERLIKIYAVGYGTRVDSGFLGEVASGDNFVFVTPDSRGLEAIFREIAMNIKLRLIQ